MSQPKALVLIVAGFEEIEAITIIDVLRRAKVDVFVAGLESGLIEGAHGITLQVDGSLESLPYDRAHIDLVALPGGMPGAQTLHDDPRVADLLRAIADKGAYVAAICAAPIALVPAGLAEGRSLTCYPGFESRLPGAQVREDRVVIDDHLITSRGPGTALEFSLSLVSLLCSPDLANELSREMLLGSPTLPHKA